MKKRTVIEILLAAIIGITLLVSLPNDESTNQEENSGKKIVEDITWNILLPAIVIITVLCVVLVVRFYNQFGAE